MVIKVIATRSEVANGDDASPMTFEFANEISFLEIFNKITKENFFPSIHGGKATWIAASVSLLAVMAQEWKIPRLLSDATFNSRGFEKFDFIDNVLRIHFNYMAQLDPEEAYRIFSRVKTTSSSY